MCCRNLVVSFRLWRVSLFNFVKSVGGNSVLPVWVWCWSRDLVMLQWTRNHVRFPPIMFTCTLHSFAHLRTFVSFLSLAPVGRLRGVCMTCMPPTSSSTWRNRRAGKKVKSQLFWTPRIWSGWRNQTGKAFILTSWSSTNAFANSAWRDRRCQATFRVPESTPGLPPEKLPLDAIIELYILSLILPLSGQRSTSSPSSSTVTSPLRNVRAVLGLHSWPACSSGRITPSLPAALTV